MNTHDVLAFAIAQEAIRRIGSGLPPWTALLSPTTYITSSRVWPMPDFVLVDASSGTTVAAEFKPPQQTKREYLTGLGQATAYTRDFHYSLLVVPIIADDGYRISDHIASVFADPAYVGSPVGVLTYDPASFSPSSPIFTETRFATTRGSPPSMPAQLDTSFYAKWREMAPEELLQLLVHSYDEMRKPAGAVGTIRDRAFDALWNDIQLGAIHHWAGGTRHYAAKNKVAVNKNYRNFVFHIGWTESDGKLTRDGLNALHVGTLYGAWSRPFLDTIAIALLSLGKHLILFNAISEFQDTTAIADEVTWLSALEDFLEAKGLIKRNAARHLAAVANSARGFLKAEKQIWKRLELIIPRGSRVFHPNRGFIFNWSRITALLQGTS